MEMTSVRADAASISGTEAHGRGIFDAIVDKAKLL